MFFFAIGAQKSPSAVACSLVFLTLACALSKSRIQNRTSSAPLPRLRLARARGYIRIDLFARYGFLSFPSTNQGEMSRAMHHHIDTAFPPSMTGVHAHYMFPIPVPATPLHGSSTSQRSFLTSFSNIYVCFFFFAIIPATIARHRIFKYRL